MGKGGGGDWKGGGLSLALVSLMRSSRNRTARDMGKEEGGRGGGKVAPVPSFLLRWRQGVILRTFRLFFFLVVALIVRVCCVLLL